MTNDSVTAPVGWICESGTEAPRAVSGVDDRAGAAAVLRRLLSGETLQWNGNFANGRQFLKSLERRLHKRAGGQPPSDASRLWAYQRDNRSKHVETLGRLTVLLQPDGSVDLPKAPDTAQAVDWAWGASPIGRRVSLRSLLGALSSAEWRRKGLEITGLDGRLHPHYGVFSPTRSAYVDLVLAAWDGGPHRVLDVGCGTGVLSFLALQRGALLAVGGDVDPRAVECAAANAEMLGLTTKFTAVQADLFPSDETFDRVLFNAPWMPQAPRTRLDRAIYDEGGRALTGWLDGLAAHLAPGGEGWLILSDLPVRLGLRSADWLESAVGSAGLRVLSRASVPARHGRAQPDGDAVARARADEQIWLWRLAT